MISKSLELNYYLYLSYGIKAYQQGRAHLYNERHLSWQDPHPHRLWEYASALEVVGDLAQYETVINVGCGESAFGTALAQCGLAVLEVDNDPNMVERAWHAQCGDVDQHDVCEPFGDKWDVVTCVSVLERVPSDKQDLAWNNLIEATGKLLYVTVDCGYDLTKPWVSDADRGTRFTMDMLAIRASRLREQGFTVHFDQTWNGAQVYDYSFCRIVATR